MFFVFVFLFFWFSCTRIHKTKKAKKKVLRDSSQGSGSPTESLRIVFLYFCFFCFFFFCWLVFVSFGFLAQESTKTKKSQKQFLRDSSQGSGSPTESLRIVCFFFFLFLFGFFLVFLHKNAQKPKKQQNNPERLFPGVRLPTESLRIGFFVCFGFFWFVWFPCFFRFFCRDFCVYYFLLHVFRVCLLGLL